MQVRSGFSQTLNYAIFKYYLGYSKGGFIVQTYEYSKVENEVESKVESQSLVSRHIILQYVILQSHLTFD